AFDRDGLQCDGVLEPADHHVGASTYSERRAYSCAPVVSLQRALAEVSARGNHRPEEHCGMKVADVCAELSDRPVIVFGVTGLQRIRASQVPGRTKNEAPS